MSKNVIITGVNGGIGRKTAKKFSDEGYHVIGTDINPDGRTHCDDFWKTDIEISREISSFCKEIKKKYEQINALVNNAAIQIESPLVKTDIDDWDSIFATNVRSIFLLTKHLVDLLRGGSIINISSVHARATSKGLSAYAASKGAVCSLTRSMALELAEDDIRANAILPGAINTEMLEQGLKRNRDYEKARQKLIEGTPLKKVGNPEDVAKLIYFLADPSLSGNITGQEFICDGGVLAQLASET